jgi:hypothetical protein
MEETNKVQSATTEAEGRPVVQEVKNFARFYALLHQLMVMGHCGSATEVKEEWVWRFTLHRTKHLREMRLEEYQLMCRTMEGVTVNEMARRKERSRVLFQMQRLGVDTTQWDRVNAFCRDGRIAGKEFAQLTVDELAKLRVKLYMIERHGGLEQVTKQVGAEALEAMK